ncbi:hypothetical protein C2845_PM05G22940 [Panicum miliaceum]|uniref:Uncharacterized protein n=1 Tax=Panicum miliaceum TaxID=4540 RepID=A0A3L6SYJ2_PANMI|nr:hypothetical protein C2845_PM05G22940 [Panicum miliaceum]
MPSRSARYLSLLRFPILAPAPPPRPRTTTAAATVVHEARMLRATISRLGARIRLHHDPRSPESRKQATVPIRSIKPRQKHQLRASTLVLLLTASPVLLPCDVCPSCAAAASHSSKYSSS